MTLSAQMPSIHTEKSDVLAKKYKTFVLVDKATNYVLAKTPVKYDAGTDMPTCFFTVDIPEGLTEIAKGSHRFFVIHSLQETDEDWVLENSDSEKDIFFGRGRFVVNAATKQWFLTIDNDRVVIESRHGVPALYLAVDDSGDLKPVKEKSKASRWKLYYVY